MERFYVPILFFLVYSMDYGFPMFKHMDEADGRVGKLRWLKTRFKLSFRDEAAWSEGLRDAHAPETEAHIRQEPIHSSMMIMANYGSVFWGAADRPACCHEVRWLGRQMRGGRGSGLVGCSRCSCLPHAEAKVCEMNNLNKHLNKKQLL